MKGLRRATLEALCTRGPWRVEGEWVDSAFVRVVYGLVETGEIMNKPRGLRTYDLSLRMLCKAGLIECAGKPRRWRLPRTSEGGDDATAS